MPVRLEAATGAVVVDSHPYGARYCGRYALVQPPLNNKQHYRNARGIHLYFYNQGSGGVPSWSFDARAQNGVDDFCEGGWIDISGGPAHPPFGSSPLLEGMSGDFLGHVVIRSDPSGDWTGEPSPRSCDRIRVTYATAAPPPTRASGT